MKRPFILLATQRTGSSWVQEMLNSHPDLKVYNELFLADARGVSIWEPRDVEFATSYLEKQVRGRSRWKRGYWTVRYLRHVFDQPQVHGVGFKYMYDQVAHSRAVLPYAAMARIPVVHLVRRNLLDVVISSRLAEASGIYHLPTDGRPPIPWAPSDPLERRISLEPAEAVAELTRLTRERQRFRRWLHITRTPTCEVEYETLVADSSAFGRILAFLGLPAEDAKMLRSGLKKLRTVHRSEVVTNFADLEFELGGTPFAVYLRS